MLVYQTADSVPTNVTLFVNGNSVWLLNSSGQTPSSGFFLSGTTVAINGLVGAIYAAGSSSATTLYYTASNDK